MIGPSTQAEGDQGGCGVIWLAKVFCRRFVFNRRLSD
jgi:hypothetical protein